MAPLDLALGASLLGVVAWLALGVVRGGDARQAMIQLNGLVRLFILFFVTHALTRGARDALLLALVVLAAALCRASACVYFFYVYAKGGLLPEWPETMTDHHDSTLWAVAFTGLAAWALVAKRKAWLVPAAAAGVLLALAIHYNDRRIAWIEAAGGVGLVLLLALGKAPRLRRRLLPYAAALLPVAALYVLVGWQRPDRVFAPVHKIKSALTDSADPSNDARELENRGLVLTLQNHKLVGTGFGQEFTEVSTLYSYGMEGGFANYRYLPHNSLVGLVAFTGILGFPLIWTFVPAAAFLAAKVVEHARDARERALGLTAFAVPFIYSVQAFGDMGLWSMKANLLLAVSMAVSARLLVTTGAWASSGRSRSMARNAPSQSVARSEGDFTLSSGETG